MAKDFSFPFYVNNWLGGTMYLTFEQKGAYLELLLLQFNKGKFTETLVKQVLKTSYTSVWPVLLEKFETDGTYFWNEKMEEVKEERQNFINSRKTNRLGKTRKTSVKHMKKTSKTLVNHMEGEGESEDKSKKIPTLEEFLKYAAEKLKTKYLPLKSTIELKYDSWKENGWAITRDGKDEPILNWKKTLLNTFQYMKPIYTESQAQIPSE